MKEHNNKWGISQLLLTLLFGIQAVYFESRDIKESSIFGGGLFASVPFYILFILVVISIIKNCTQYKENETIVPYLPSIIGLIFLAIIANQKLQRSRHDDSPILFTATNDNLGTDGGFTFQFKENNYLTGKKIDRFNHTTYWGTYQQKEDTIILTIPLDFQLGREAILQDSVLLFPQDSLVFNIFNK